MNPARAVNASAYPVRASAPNPVYASSPGMAGHPRGPGGGRAVRAERPGPGHPAARPPGPIRAHAVITIEEIVITAVAAVCAFVAVLVFVLRMSARRRAARRDPARRSRRIPAGAGQLGGKILVVRPG